MPVRTLGESVETVEVDLFTRKYELRPITRSVEAELDVLDKANQEKYGEADFADRHGLVDDPDSVPARCLNLWERTLKAIETQDFAAMQTADLVALNTAQVRALTTAEIVTATPAPRREVRDTVLQRAVDILKGIRVLLSSR